MKAIGIDIGGTNIELGVVDSNWTVEGLIRTKTAEYNSFDSFVKFLDREISNFYKQFGNIKGIGIGAPNANRKTGEIQDAPNISWGGNIKIVETLEKKFSTEVQLTNDANAMAFGEQNFGLAKKHSNFISITLGTGLGSGIVIADRILYGATGFAGELGHVIVENNGRKCNCGRNGCLEKYVSDSGIVETALEILKEGKTESTLRKIIETKLTAKIIYQHAIKNDIIANKTFKITGKILGKALANVVLITSPSIIILSGGIAKAGEKILKPTKQAMNENLLSTFKGTVEIEVSKQKNLSVLGAASMIING